MPKIISVHSFRAGTGRTTLIANFASLLAASGRRIGIIDTSLRAPGMASHFGLPMPNGAKSFHAYYEGHCSLIDAVRDVTPDGVRGRLLLIPAGAGPRTADRIWREGYDLLPIGDDVLSFAEMFALEAVFIDTDAGLDSASISLIALADVLAVVLRHDRRDYQTTGVVVDLARKLELSEIFLIANEVPANFDPAEFETQAAQTYQCRMAGAFPYVEELAALIGTGIFALQYPDHPVTAAMQAAAELLLA